MTCSQVWQGIDRLSFFENAILLELKYRSQGKPVKMHYPNIEKNPLDQEARYFLDDFALLASGPGGPDNVSAACMEISERDDRMLVLRLARNGGINDEMLCRLQGTIRRMIKNISSGISEEQAREEALLEIMIRCKSRLAKHTKALGRMLRFVGSHGSNQFSSSQIMFACDKTESLQDIEVLGIYCDATHESYMRLCKHRLKQLKELVSRISLSTTPSEMQDLSSLTKLAYQVRRSHSFKQLVAYNISRSEKPGVAVPNLRDIVERIGQISKFYRAAATLTAFLANLQKLGIDIEIKATSTEKIEVSELAFRTATQVHHRGGNAFNSSSGRQIQNMINRWQGYREHVELQLLIFYEQNHGLILFSPYIGCNKRSCYLCYNFIIEHGRFQVDGCHQSVYSLWAVRETISFADEERADVFNRALKMLCSDLEQKIQDQKGPHWRRPGFSTHNESVANLSRVSLAFNPCSVWEPYSKKRASHAVANPAEKSFRAITSKRNSVYSSMADLAPVPEEALEEVMEVGVDREPMSSHTVLPEESIDITRGSSFSQVEPDAIASQLRSNSEPILIAPSTSTQSDPVPTQGPSSISIAGPFLSASAVECSEAMPRESPEPRVPHQSRRKHRRHNHLGHQSHHSRTLQHDSRASGRLNKGRGSTTDRVASKKRGKRPIKTPKQRESQSRRRRVIHDRRLERRSSLRQKLVGIINVVLAAFRRPRRQKPRRK